MRDEGARSRARARSLSLSSTSHHSILPWRTGRRRPRSAGSRPAGILGACSHPPAGRAGIPKGGEDGREGGVEKRGLLLESRRRCSLTRPEFFFVLSSRHHRLTTLTSAKCHSVSCSPPIPPCPLPPRAEGGTPKGGGDGAAVRMGVSAAAAVSAGGGVCGGAEAIFGVCAREADARSTTPIGRPEGEGKRVRGGVRVLRAERKERKEWRCGSGSGRHILKPAHPQACSYSAHTVCSYHTAFHLHHTRAPPLTTQSTLHVTVVPL